jgi:hypothetical protein
MEKHTLKTLFLFFKELDTDDCPEEIRKKIQDVLAALKSEIKRR